MFDPHYGEITPNIKSRIKYCERSSIDRQTDKTKKNHVACEAHVWTSQDDDYTTQNSLFYTINVNTSNALPTIIPYYYFWDDGDVSGNLRARILE